MLSEAAVKRHALETREQKNAASLKRNTIGGKDLILREWLYNDNWCGVPGCEWRACGDGGTAGRNRHRHNFHTLEERAKINDEDDHLIKLFFSWHFSKPQDANKYPEAAKQKIHRCKFCKLTPWGTSRPSQLSDHEKQFSERIHQLAESMWTQREEWNRQVAERKRKLGIDVTTTDVSSALLLYDLPN